MEVKVELSEKEIREAIYAYIKESAGIDIPASAVKIQVKSKQNFKSEWEEAAFRAHFAFSRPVD